MNTSRRASAEDLARVAAARLIPTMLVRSLVVILLCEAARTLIAYFMGHPPDWAEVIIGWLLIAAVGLPILYFTSLPLVTSTVAKEMTKAANARFESVAGQVQDGILIYDVNGVIQYVNPAVERIHGFRKGALAGRNVEVIIPEELRPAFFQDLHTVRETGSGEIIGKGFAEVESQSSDGRRLRLEISATPVLQGRQVQVVAVMRDITERKRAEREIARLVQFPNLNPNPVLECEPGGQICYANSGAKRLLGSLSSSATAQILIPGFSELARRCQEQGPIHGLETTVRGRTLLWLLQPGEESRILVYGTDITERKQAEEARHRSEQQMLDLMDKLPVAVCVAVDGKTVFANPAAVTQFGYRSLREMLAAESFSTFAEKDRERLRGYDQARVAGGSAPALYETTGRRADGTEFPVEVTATRFFYEGRAGSLLVTRDLTDQRRLRLYEQILPVCCMCGKIRDDSGAQQGQGEWGRLDHYVMRHSNTQLSHTFCPQCYEQYRREQGLAPSATT
jgi:PAS domain S-box-containing protein